MKKKAETTFSIKDLKIIQKNLSVKLIKKNRQKTKKIKKDLDLGQSLSKKAKNKPVISIGMPVHNAGTYLEISIKSILNQSFTKWELIIADDKSNDNALRTLSKSLLQDPRIKIIWCSRQGGIALRLNQIVRKAQGMYFARMDADDVSHPERLTKQLEFLKNNPKTNLLGCSCVLINEKNQITGRLNCPTKHSQICQSPWKGFLLVHPSWMGKTKWFRQNPYQVPAPYLCEDQELLLRLHRSANFANLPKAYLAYRIREHTRLGQLLKTRIAWWSVQKADFIKRGEIENLILGFMNFLGKTFLDFLRHMTIFGKRRPLWGNL